MNVPTRLLMTTALLLSGVASAPAAEVAGTVGVEGLSVDYESNNRYKATEYRDQERGVRGFLDLSLREGDYRLNLTGENFGYNGESNASYRDERYTLTAGRTDMFRFTLLYDETPHNLTYGARALLSGIGTSQLAYSGTEVPLDYQLHRKNYAAGFEGNFGTPFFIALKAERQERDGLLPIGTGELFTPFELPAPIATSTDTYSLQAGYQGDRFSLVLDGAISQFESDDQYLYFTDNIPSPTVPITLASDSDQYKVGGTLRLKLPAATLLTGRVSYTKVTSDLGVPAAAGGPNIPLDGDIATTTADVSVTSSPVRSLDLKAFYSYLDRQDDSSINLLTLDGDNADKRYSFDRNRMGVEAGYRLTTHTKVRGGLELLQTDRDSARYAADTDDLILFAEVKNSSLDFMTARLRYQYLDRNGSGGIKELDPATSVTPYDIADKQQHSFKAVVDVQPADGVNVGFEYQARLSDFDSDLGVTKDNRHQFAIDASWQLTRLRLAGRAGWEWVERDLSSRSSTGYAWKSTRDDTNSFYGISATLDIIKDRLQAELGWDYEKADGDADYSTSPPQATVVDLNTVDTYTRRRLNASLICRLGHGMTLKGGYVYEKLAYSDNGWDSYLAVPTAVPFGVGFLTGAYADPDYRAHLGYLQLSYAF
jgi:MtrB/PioB family decaheme-associated outer membrane protein